jgi:methylated-DNA-protein-cysteine methyltransferase-like protein
MANEYRERIYRLARQIPEGRVMTYGQIAEILDSDAHKYTPQTVGWAMHALGDSDCWARVINASGGCSTGKVMAPSNKQQFILEQEGVVFNEQGKCDLEKCLWIPGAAVMIAAREWRQEDQ